MSKIHFNKFDEHNSEILSKIENIIAPNLGEIQTFFLSHDEKEINSDSSIGNIL